MGFGPRRVQTHVLYSGPAGKANSPRSRRGRIIMDSPKPQKISQGIAEAALPLEDYDSLSADEIVQKLAGLSPEEVEKLCRYESANQNRKNLLRYFKHSIGAAAATSASEREDPPPGEERPEKRREAAMRTIAREEPPPGEERPERRVP